MRRRRARFAEAPSRKPRGRSRTSRPPIERVAEMRWQCSKSRRQCRPTQRQADARYKMKDARYKIATARDDPLSSPDEKLSCDPGPRSGDRYIAWGVSPRIRARIKEKAAERRQKCGADAIGSRRSTNLSPPPGACGLFAVPTLGLTPQAKNMPLLRSSSSGVNLFQDETIGWISHLASWILYPGRRKTPGYN